VRTGAFPRIGEANSKKIMKFSFYLVTSLVATTTLASATDRTTGGK